MTAALISKSWFEHELGGHRLALTPFARRAELRFLRHFVPGQALEKNGHTSVGLQTAYYDDHFNFGVDAEYTDGFLYEFQDNPSRFSFVQGLHYDYEVSSIVGAAYRLMIIPITQTPGEADASFA